jgi:hypothetical protein
VDATGTANKSSVWFLEVGPEMVEFLFGRGKTITMGEEWDVETVLDSNNKEFQAYTNWLNGRVGARLANKHAAVRIKNLGTAAGKKLTDALMFSALEKCDELGMTPNVIFGRPRSFYQLQESRTATTKDGRPAPLPRDWEGIPIVPTINITTSETA